MPGNRARGAIDEAARERTHQRRDAPRVFDIFGEFSDIGIRKGRGLCLCGGNVRIEVAYQEVEERVNPASDGLVAEGRGADRDIAGRGIGREINCRHELAIDTKNGALFGYEEIELVGGAWGGDNAGECPSLVRAGIADDEVPVPE